MTATLSCSQTTMVKRLLLLGAETPALQRVVPMLLRSDFLVHRVDQPGEALRTLAESRFDLVIARYPLAELSLAGLVQSLRGTLSPSRGAGLLVLADPAHVGDIAAFLGRGVNRVVSVDGPSERLLTAVADLVGVAPRRLVRAVVELELWMRRETQRLLTLTENVSVSGMLVRGGREFPVGAKISFELVLPGSLGPIHGEGEVVRHTQVGVERVDGIGVAFLSFAGDGDRRLAMFLDRRSGGG
jgi:DNA-binding NarL/FixJ family response regulator